MTRAGGKTIVVLGMMAKMPVGGVVWQTLHYLLGFRRLGFEVAYVEAHAVAPTMFLDPDNPGDDGALRASAFLERTLGRFDLGGRWAFLARHSDGRCYGMSGWELARLFRSAELVVNLHGGTRPEPEHAANGRLVYLETDPVALQVELDEGRAETGAFLEPHCAFFTFGENLGRPGCALPVSEKFRFWPTRQPVVLGLWGGFAEEPPGESLTTVASWRQPQRQFRFRGELYTWSKDQEFLKLIDLPSRSPVPLELALGKYGEADRRLLESYGWRVRDALEVSRDAGTYRRYVGGSFGEFTAAKDQNVRFRSGWFSDRSATYLASGRPVVTQETGFSDVLPTGEGLLPYHDLDGAAEAVARVAADYARHRRGALEVARGWFDSDLVLSDLLDRVGVDWRRPAAVG